MTENAKAYIDSDEIVIKIKIKSLPGIVSGAPGSCLKVVNTKALAEELVAELNSTDEAYGSSIHKMVDAAVCSVYEGGSRSVVDGEDEIRIDVFKLIRDLCQLKTSQRISIGNFVGARLDRYCTELDHVQQMVELAQRHDVLHVIANMAKQFADENAKDRA